MKNLLLALVLVAACFTASGQENRGVFTVVVGSHPTANEAEAVQLKVGKTGLPVSTLYMQTPAGKRYRVCVGRFSSMREALAKRDDIAAKAKAPDAWALQLPTDYGDLIVDFDAIRADEEARAKAAADSIAAAEAALATAPPPPGEDTLFQASYQQCLGAWNRGDLAIANTFLHPVVGLYVIYRHEGRVVARQFRTLEALMGSEILGISESVPDRLGPQLAYYNSRPTGAELPRYFCEGAREGYAAEGFFAGRPYPTQVLLYATMAQLKQTYLGQPLTPAEAAQLASVESDIELGVVHTDALLLRGLFWSELHGQWYLTLIDLVNPCGG